MEGMPRLLIPLAIVAASVIIYSLVECLMTPKHLVRAMPKAAWVLVILLVPVVGALLWLFLGRARKPKPAAARGPAPRVASPDDDETFLRQLDIQRRQQARQAEMDRREAELRAREQKSAPQDPDLPEDPEAPSTGNGDGTTPPQG